MAGKISALKVMDRLLLGIEIGESQYREFKSAMDRSDGGPTPRDPKSVCKDIGETLVAFANADGGELFVGVEDDRTVSGVGYKDAIFSMLAEAWRTHVLAETPLPTPTVARVNVEGKTILYFQVSKSTERVVLTADGRCLQRFDRENRPVSAEQIQYDRQERTSLEFDRTFVDGAELSHLDVKAIEQVSRHIAGGQSAEKFLQFFDLAEYGVDGLRLRRAALLLFASDITRWHPRCEVRIVRVSGTALGVGKDYNVRSRDDNTTRGNVLFILENAWETLRPYLAQTKLAEAGLFRENLVYPEDACREALVNAVAHRDYSIEGKGIEIFIFDDRLEVKSPGGLLSSIALEDLIKGKRTHQSRNVYVARVLREIGYMREMGEGMLRIYSTMRDSDLVPPELETDANRFDLVLHHRSVFSPKDQEWLRAYSTYNLSRDEERVVLLGKDGHLLSMNAIVNALNIVDTDEFRKVIERLRRKGILHNALNREGTNKAFHKGKKREIGRFAIRPPDQTEQYRQELLNVIGGLGPREAFTFGELKAVSGSLSTTSPYRENAAESLKLLGLVDDRLRALPLLRSTYPARFELKITQTGKERVPLDLENAKPLSYATNLVRPRDPENIAGEVVLLNRMAGYGFIRTEKGDFYFRRSSLVAESNWGSLKVGTRVLFASTKGSFKGKAPLAIGVVLAEQ